ncbi:AGAP001117-PB [Anopheles gambiae str. PEST]|uniref:Gustatory receptor n=1 Tax=Anopheles gambiae TaxID=7165 RepID=Q7PKG9_ANOGA|nr:AGAP001117-PB [Anopheles gambiae str. PEST]
MSLFGEDALVAYETFSVLLKYLGVNPPISCDRKRTRLPYRCVNILSFVLSTLFYGYLLFSISLDSGVLKAGIKSLIVTRMHDLYFVLRYITVIVVQVHVLNNGGEINRMLRALNSISNAVTLLANRKGVSSKLRFFGTVRFAKGLRVFSLSYPFVCLAITFTILKWLNWNQLIGHVFQFVRLLYFTTYVHLWLQATLAAMLVLSRYEALKDLFGMYFPTSPSAVGNPSEFAICSEKEQINVLKQIKILHDKLNDVVELVNYCFSVQGKRIGILVHKAINCSSSSAVINEVQCCEGANMMLPVCNVPCAWIILILYLSRQLNLFSQQLLHRSPVITCGLFVYDWTLWYTMIGATATYLIILIQFDVSFPNLVNVNATAVYRGST